jgi:protein-S-isoprenylcysteine O-methyltransferase Ste14
MEVWILLSAAVLLGGLLWTARIMKRSGIFGNKDTANSEQVGQHPYGLNPIIWLYVALFVVFLGIVAIVWAQGR